MVLKGKVCVSCALVAALLKAQRVSFANSEIAAAVVSVATDIALVVCLVGHIIPLGIPVSTIFVDVTPMA
jgi:hypothetical protein